MIHCFATTSFEIVLHFLHSWSLLNIMLLCILMMHFKSMVLFLKCLTALMQLHSVRCTAHVIQCNVHCAMCNIHCLLHCAVQCSAVQYSSILLIVVQGARWWWGGAMEWWWCYTVQCTMEVVVVVQCNVHYTMHNGGREGVRQRLSCARLPPTS